MVKLIYNNDQTGHITFDNLPESHALSAAFDTLEKVKSFFEDEKLKGVIIEIRGDQPWSEKIFPGNQFAKLLHLIRFAPVPAIAVIYGKCMGKDLRIALACHFRVSSSGAVFGFTDCGTSEGYEQPLRSFAKKDRGTINRLLTTGKVFSAREALACGLIDAAVQNEPYNAANAFIQAIVSKHSNSSIRLVMRTVHNAIQLTKEQALKEEISIFRDLARHYDPSK